MPSINEKLGGAVSVKYFDLSPYGVGARAGPLFFLLSSLGVEWSEDFDVGYPGTPQWAAIQDKLRETGENPCAQLPITKFGDVSIYQVVPTLRYIVYATGFGSTVPWDAWTQDALASHYNSWRDAWAGKVFGDMDASEDELTAASDKYKSTTLPPYLKAFEAMYKQFAKSGTYAGGSDTPLHGDVCVASQLYDEIAVGHLTESQLSEEYPKLYAVYKAVTSIPKVQAWCTRYKEAASKKN